jgi:uncharacterized protein (DUF885 family)
MNKVLFRVAVVCALIFMSASCSRDTNEQKSAVVDTGSEAEVIAIADDYIKAWFENFPEMATFYRIEGATHDRLTKNTPEGRAAWEAIEDRLLAELVSVDAESLRGTAAWLPYGILLENLEASRDARICRQHSWNIDQVWGWQIYFGELATAQPVSNDEERAMALVRWRQIPQFIDNEIQNLKDGLAAGFSTPQRNVSLVVEQLDDLLGMAPEDSPFFAPAGTVALEQFSKDLAEVLSGEIYPAMRRYRDFLVNEYHDQARTKIAVAALPDGKACYAARLRMFTTLPYQPEEMFAAGNEAVALRESQISVVGEREISRRRSTNLWYRTFRSQARRNSIRSSSSMLSKALRQTSCTRSSASDGDDVKRRAAP